ncbi:MAG: hypothetical protein Fur006_63210 [Coleofasciculaceae cyanobacterium]
MGGQDAHPTRKVTFCGTGILPVLENGARAEIENKGRESFGARLVDSIHLSLIVE